MDNEKLGFSPGYHPGFWYKSYQISGHVQAPFFRVGMGKTKSNFYSATSLHSELWALQPMMVLKRFGKVLLCGARQAMVKRSSRIGAVIMEAGIMENGMAIGKMAKLLAGKKESFLLEVVDTPTVVATTIMFAKPIEG